MLTQIEKLRNLVLAPYIIKATSLIGTQRNVGGNQFRHALATMAILIDYRFLDSEVLLQAAVIHDLLEDVPDTDERELRQIEEHADQVVDLVLEVTQPPWMSKVDYLLRIQNQG